MRSVVCSWPFKPKLINKVALQPPLFCVAAYNGQVQKFEDPNVYKYPKYLTTIVAGSAGSKEKISKSQGPAKTRVTSVLDYG